MIKDYVDRQIHGTKLSRRFFCIKRIYGMAKFYMDDHNNISGDHYMDLLNMNQKECDTMDSKRPDLTYNNDIYPPRHRSDMLVRMCNSEMLFRIQKGINDGQTCVLKILFGSNNIQCRDDHDCDKCICEEICKKLE